MLAFKLWPTPLPLCLSTILTKVSLKMPYSITSSCPTELSTQSQTCLESFVSAFQSQGQWLESRRWGLSLPAMLKNLALTVAEASVSSTCPFPPHCYQQDMPQPQAHQWKILLEPSGCPNCPTSSPPSVCQAPTSHQTPFSSSPACSNSKTTSTPSPWPTPPWSFWSSRDAHLFDNGCFVNWWNDSLLLDFSVCQPVVHLATNSLTGLVVQTCVIHVGSLVKDRILGSKEVLVNPIVAALTSKHNATLWQCQVSHLHHLFRVLLAVLHYSTTTLLPTSLENIVSSINRNPRSRNFSQYWRVSSIEPPVSKNCDFCLFSPKNPKIPEIRRKFREFAEKS